MPYMRKNHRINIGERTAENLKVILGTACADTPESKLTVKGGDMVSGLPTEIEVSSKEMYKAMSECVTAIVDAIFHVLEQTPPELCSDISDRGIVLTGGGSLISGLDRAVEERTGIRCVTAEDPISCVAIGTGKFLEYLNGGNRFTSEEIKNPEESIDK